MSYQQTIVVGHLGGDPELKMVNGREVCNFSVAVGEKWTQDGEARERTTWYRVAVWGNSAKACQAYLVKGSQVMVMGNVSVDAYIDKQGEAAGSLRLNAQTVRFLGKPEDQDNQDTTPSSRIPF